MHLHGQISKPLVVLTCVLLVCRESGSEEDQGCDSGLKGDDWEFSCRAHASAHQAAEEITVASL